MVIKTLPGMAQAAAASIDAMSWTEIVGTLAGDDTIFAIFRSEAAALGYTGELNKMLK
ncbi:Arginine repressor [bioreactor metagenome]|uniref:Arginine repressor n=1 Tax=bioreactor metagenome TaxID=1076179 RepID=A0A645C5Y2_9ZZZZ